MRGEGTAVCNWYHLYIVRYLPLSQSSYNPHNVCLFVSGATAHSGPGPPHSPGFQITHNDAPHSLGLLWTSDQLVAEPST
jgi:hypothetical protein